MKVKDVLLKNVITVHPDATHEEASRLFYKSNISGAPVVNSDGRLVGMLSEKDLFRALYPTYRSFFESPEYYLDEESREADVAEVRTQKISEIMSTAIFAIQADTPIRRAGAIMLAKGIHRLPVLEDGKLVGLVTRDHIYKAILKKHLGL
jgi:CBS domain-containing protein